MQDNGRFRRPSASSWRRRELCAGSYRLELEAEQSGQAAHERSVEAGRGTRIHAWLAGETVDLDESELATAQFLKERAFEQVERIFGGFSPNVMREKRLWLEVDGKPALSGRFDVVYYTDKQALVQDYKTGFGEPDPAQQNAQLRVLAVLLAFHQSTIEEVIVQIISGPYGVTEARFTIAQLATIYEEIIATLRAINSKDAPLNPSPEACRFCKATMICPALRAELKPVEQLDVYALPDGAQAGDLLGRIELFQDLIDEIRAYYTGRLAEPAYSIPGWALVPGAGVREVTDWGAALEKLKDHLSPEALNGAAAYRLGDLERSLAKEKGIKQKEAKPLINQILDGLITLKAKAPSLKRTGPKLVVSQRHAEALTK